MNSVYNPKTEGAKEYAEQQHAKFKSGQFSFTPAKIIKDEHITEYEKLFITDNLFHAVKPLVEKRYLYAYRDHIKSHQNIYFDHKNKTMLISNTFKP